MDNSLQECFDEFLAAAHRVAKHGLVACGSGNLSWQVNEAVMLVTAAGSWMAELSQEDVAVCRIMDGVSLNDRRPSKEIGFHAGILREREDVHVVLHFQSPCATTIACLEPMLTDFSVIIEIPHYIGPVAVVPYLAPGSSELAEAVTSAMREHELAILRNHGLVVVGEDFDQATAKATHFELACKIILGAGGQVQFLQEDAAADLFRQGVGNRSKESSG